MPALKHGLPGCGRTLRQASDKLEEETAGCNKAGQDRATVYGI